MENKVVDCIIKLTQMGYDVCFAEDTTYEPRSFSVDGSIALEFADNLDHQLVIIVISNSESDTSGFAVVEKNEIESELELAIKLLSGIAVS